MGLLTILYLIGSVTFILGLKCSRIQLLLEKLKSISSSRNDSSHFRNYFSLSNDEEGKIRKLRLDFSESFIGTIVGALAAKSKMTAMPQMVSIFNGMGGAYCCFNFFG